MEHILVSNIMQHLDSKKILYALQHGFRKNFSCDTRLLSLFQDLSSNPSQTDLIIMDFSKAFDKVPHRRRQYKLNWYGIRGTTHAWIQHFLQGRSQRVVSEGTQSSSHPVLSGVPQAGLASTTIVIDCNRLQLERNRNCNRNQFFQIVA